MFTGLVETIGSVRLISPSGQKVRLMVRPSKKMRHVRMGESVAVNGVCLTVVQIKNNELGFDAVAETLRRTNLGGLEAGSRVNLERALRFGDRLGGHFVTGHIQGVGRVARWDLLKGKDKERILWIKTPAALIPAIIAKGSIAIDGVSLTVGKVTRSSFNVYLIPHTLRETTLGAIKPGSTVNLETDILIRTLLSQK